MVGGAAAGRTTKADHPVEGVAGMLEFLVLCLFLAHKQQGSRRGKDLRTEGEATPEGLCRVKPSC